MGKHFTNPTKIKEPISNSSAERFTGNIEFSADSEGYQVLLCGAKPPTDATVTVSYFSPKDAYCNYPIKFEKSDTLKCAYEPEPILTRLTVPIGPISFIQNISCGPENTGTWFHFVYKVNHFFHLNDRHAIQKSYVKISKLILFHRSVRRKNRLKMQYIRLKIFFQKLVFPVQ